MANSKSIIILNLAMLMMSTSGPLGRYIQLDPPLIIWYRCIVAVVLIGLFCVFKKLDFRLQKVDWPVVFGSGVLLSVHWVSYFYSLQMSNVAIGMLSLFTYPVMTALLEPFILRTKLKIIHLVLAAIALLGVYFLIPDIEFSSSYGYGLFIGLGSALCYSLRNILMKSKVSSYPGPVLMFYQLLIVCVTLIPTVFFMSSQPLTTEWPWVLTLAVVTTALAHTLFLSSFRYFSITTISILSSVQPVYGVILAAIFINEIPTWNIYIGGFLILSTVFIEAFRTTRKPKATS